MLNLPRAWAVPFVVAALCCAGCGSVSNVSVDKTQAAQVRTVALVQVPDLDEMDIANRSIPLGPIGLVTGGVRLVLSHENKKRFNEAFAAKKPPFSQALTDSMCKALEADGYTVILALDQQANPDEDNAADAVADVHVSADTILTLWYREAGYCSAAFSVSYVPKVLISARLIDARTKKELYAKTFAVGVEPSTRDVVSVEADPKYRYRSFDALFAHKDEAVAGLLESAPKAAALLQADLKVAQK